MGAGLGRQIGFLAHAVVWGGQRTVAVRACGYQGVSFGLRLDKCDADPFSFSGSDKFLAWQLFEPGPFTSPLIKVGPEIAFELRALQRQLLRAPSQTK